VLDEVSLRAEAGEFVAVVGPSGSGKSTLLRLLLGFERPDSGAVLYDRQDLEDVDVGAVRRQCGVVLQDDRLLVGDLRTNIVGAGRYSEDEAWEAARQVGLADDVERMPMGMATYVGEGSGSLSGGQRQRVILARAMVSRPRILYLDEATSALDNRTQELVTESMRQLSATRIVIAHRLSTIRDADRILVMDAGRVVESGTYDELMQAGGLFRELAERQLA
jgi:ABC-type bacteriocin/lantibiotic exporter with double-glycine peptidase domain